MDQKIDIKELIKSIELEQNPNQVIFDELQQTNEELGKLNESLLLFYDVNFDGLQKIRGEKGEPGITPVKGVDFLTPEEVEQIKQEITPVKGTGYFTAEEIAQFKEEVTPVKGVDYIDGEDGKDGKDADEKKIISRLEKLIPSKEEIVASIPKPKDGKDITEVDPQLLAERLNTLEGAIDPKVIDGYFSIEDVVKEIKKNKSLELRDIKGAKLDMSDMRWHGSGVPSLTAGSNITLTPTADGGYTIASSGGTGSGYQQPTSGVVDGSNTTFTFATAPNALVVDQGRVMQKTSSDGTVNWTGTLTVTLTIAPNIDIFAIA